MEEVKHTFSLICLCSRFAVSEKLFEKTIEELEKLFPSKVRKKEEEISRKLGILSIEESYSIGKNKITLHITTLPSQDKVYARIDEIMASKRIKEVLTETMSDEKKKELMEKAKALYRKLHTRFFTPKEESLYFSLRCEPIEEERILDTETLWELSPPIKKFLGLTEQISPEFIPTRSCLELTYDPKKYKVVGGFSLPTKIPLSQKVVERLGEADVSGFHLSFKESPLNINRIEIRLILDNINVFAEFSSKMHISEKVCQEVYEYGVQVSNLFVEAI